MLFDFLNLHFNSNYNYTVTLITSSTTPYSVLHPGVYLSIYLIHLSLIYCVSLYLDLCLITLICVFILIIITSEDCIASAASVALVVSVFCLGGTK